MKPGYADSSAPGSPVLKLYHGWRNLRRPVQQGCAPRPRQPDRRGKAALVWRVIPDLETEHGEVVTEVFASPRRALSREVRRVERAGGGFRELPEDIIALKQARYPLRQVLAGGPSLELSQGGFQELVSGLSQTRLLRDRRVRSARDGGRPGLSDLPEAAGGGEPCIRDLRDRLGDQDGLLREPIARFDEHLDVARRPSRVPADSGARSRHGRLAARAYRVCPASFPLAASICGGADEKRGAERCR